MHGFKGRRKFRQHAFAAAADKVIGLARPHARKIARQAADVIRDRHVVIVEDNEHIVVECAGVIERFEGHARGHRTVAYDGNRVTVFRSSLLAFSGHHA